jgi:hypothetical protein
MQLAVDSSAARQMLAQLEAKELRKITKSAFRSAANVLKSQAHRNFKAMFPGSKLYLNIAAMPFKAGDGSFVKVPLKLGEKKREKIDRKAGLANTAYRAYVLQYLEGGTAPRKTEKGYARGKLRAYRFMAKAEETHGKKALEKFNSVIIKRLEKLNK